MFHERNCFLRALLSFPNRASSTCLVVVICRRSFLANSIFNFVTISPCINYLSLSLYTSAVVFFKSRERIDTKMEINVKGVLWNIFGRLFCHQKASRRSPHRKKVQGEKWAEAEKNPQKLLDSSDGILRQFHLLKTIFYSKYDHYPQVTYYSSHYPFSIRQQEIRWYLKGWVLDEFTVRCHLVIFPKPCRAWKH